MLHLRAYFRVTLTATPSASSTSTFAFSATTASKVDSASPWKYFVASEQVTSTFFAPLPIVNFFAAALTEEIVPLTAFPWALEGYFNVGAGFVRKKSCR